jgi:hypothetical protein
MLDRSSPELRAEGESLPSELVLLAQLERNTWAVAGAAQGRVAAERDRSCVSFVQSEFDASQRYPSHKVIVSCLLHSPLPEDPIHCCPLRTDAYAASEADDRSGENRPGTLVGARNAAASVLSHLYAMSALWHLVADDHPVHDAHRSNIIGVFTRAW